MLHVFASGYVAFVFLNTWFSACDAADFNARLKQSKFIVDKKVNILHVNSDISFQYGLEGLHCYFDSILHISAIKAR